MSDTRPNVALLSGQWFRIVGGDGMPHGVLDVPMVAQCIDSGAVFTASGTHYRFHVPGMPHDLLVPVENLREPVREP